MTWESEDLSHAGNRVLDLRVQPIDDDWTGSQVSILKTFAFHTIEFTVPTANPVSSLATTFTVQDPTVTTISFDEYEISSTYPSFDETAYSISYEARLSDDSNLPSGVNFDSASRSFTIDINENSLAGDYVIKIIATTSPLGYVDET